MQIGKLAGKVAIVTGAGRGIGRSIVLAFAEEGANIVAIARNEQEIDTVSREASAYGVSALSIKTDVSQQEEVDEMVGKVLAEYGRIDILVNNAAVPGPTDFISLMKLEDWEQTIDINLKGVFLCSRAVVPQMIKQSSGNIINISSGAGKKLKEDSFISPTRSMVYSVSKAGVESFTLALAEQVSKFNINVNALRPGPTDTQIHSGSPPEKRARMRRPDDIRNVAVFMACQGPLGITGESIDAATWEKIYLKRNVSGGGDKS
jgi:3-oxoacyl-[acyl-carrier protein] reductase